MFIIVSNSVYRNFEIVNKWNATGISYFISYDFVHSVSRGQFTDCVVRHQPLQTFFFFFFLSFQQYKPIFQVRNKISLLEHPLPLSPYSTIL